MPIFQDPDRRLERPLLASPLPHSATVSYRTSEESIRTEFCEGPVPDELLPSGEAMTLPNRDVSEASIEGYHKQIIRDRAELIERIKRSHPISWRPESPTREQPSGSTDDHGTVSPRTTDSHAALLPAIQLKGPISPEQAAQNEESQTSNAHFGRAIRRPPSALHAGDFTQTTTSLYQTRQPKALAEDVQPLFSWRPSSEDSPPSPSIDISLPRRTSLHSPPPSIQSSPFEYVAPPRRSRAPSYQSFSSSFVYKPPTSPLVQQENNDDLELGLHQSQTSSKEARRRTLPADGLQHLRSLPSSLAQAARQPGASQSDLSLFSQSREARRSALFSSSFLGSVSPPTPGFLRSRRTSFSGESSPLQPSSMVGSYEESILRGRMSTTPSKPVDFTAQIGALGKGDCRPKFPDHVTLTFPAVFYNWNSFDSAVSTEPSPYVGQIDLEHGLPPPKRKERKAKPGGNEIPQDEHQDGERQHQASSAERPRRRKRSVSPSKRLLGSYRIPQRGQLQILIKNPNKTAVKLFLIPYDLGGMEPGTKTFIRQNSYSAGPIIEAPVMSRRRSESGPETKLTAGTERATLRYSIHIHICCPSKGRYYLYKSIKVVFANRVPDNKERLRNDIRLPEPRYSPYRPSSEIFSSPSMGSLRHGLEKENRRRSSQMSDNFEHITRPPHRRFPSFSPNSPSPNLPIAVTRNFSRPTPFSPPVEGQVNDFPMGEAPLLPPLSPPPGVVIGSPLTDKVRRIVPDRSDSLRSSSSTTSTDSAYNKLNKGDVGYGGLFARPGTPECSEGLLSRKLRGFESRESPSTSRNGET